MCKISYINSEHFQEDHHFPSLPAFNMSRVFGSFPSIASNHCYLPSLHMLFMSSVHPVCHLKLTIDWLTLACSQLLPSPFRWAFLSSMPLVKCSAHTPITQQQPKHQCAISTVSTEMRVDQCYIKVSVTVKIIYRRTYEGLLKHCLAFITVIITRFSSTEKLGGDDHRTVEEGKDLWRLSPTPLLKQFLTAAGWTGRCPGRSWIPPEKETLLHPWAVCSCALSLSQKRGYSSCLYGIYSVYCLLALVLSLDVTEETVWPHPLGSHA